MALSGSVKTNSYDGRYYQLNWTATQSITNNQSRITWELRAVGGNSSWYAERTLSVKVAGKTTSKTERVERYAGTVLFGDAYVTHEADGTASFSVSIEAAVYTATVNCKGSKTFTLNTIPRVSSVSLSTTSAYMGTKVTISPERMSSSFTHDLAYSFAGAAYTTIATGVGTSYTWTIPDLAAKVPNADSGALVIRCTTKNGSTTIGSKTVKMTAKVPTSVVPVISSITTAEAVSGLADQFGALIQNKSKVKATIAAAGTQGSTIKTYSATFQGVAYTGSTWTSGLLTKSGTHALKVTVTDSRGRTATKSVNVVVHAYTPPVITNFEAWRCTETGEAAHDGTAMTVRYSYNVPALHGGNTASGKVQRKLTTDTEWQTVALTTALSATNGGGLLTPVASFVFSADSQWDMRLAVTDYFGATTYFAVVIPTAEVVMDIRADGTGMGLGKVAELPGVLDIDWQVRMQKGQLPVVLENGTDLNDLLTPHTLAGKNANAGNYANCPISTQTFTLEILPAGDAGQVMQRLTTCSKEAPKVYVRWYYGGEWGGWLLTESYGA